MSMPKASHPIWSIARLTLIMAFLTLILYLNAAEFDETEHRTILYMLMVAIGSETVSFAQFMRGKSS